MTRQLIRPIYRPNGTIPILCFALDFVRRKTVDIDVSPLSYGHTMIVYYVGLLLSLAIVTECQTEKPCTTDCKCCHENGKAYCCVVEDDEHDDRFPYWTLSYLAIPVIVALSIGLSCYCRYVRMKKIQEQLQQQRQPGEVIMMQDQPPPYPVTQQNSGLSNYSQGYTPTTSCVIGPNGYPVQQTEPFKQTAGSYPS